MIVYAYIYTHAYFKLEVINLEVQVSRPSSHTPPIDNRTGLCPGLNYPRFTLPEQDRAIVKK